MMSAAIFATSPRPLAAPSSGLRHRDAGEVAPFRVTPASGRADPPGPPPPARPPAGVHPPIWSPCTAGAISAEQQHEIGAVVGDFAVEALRGSGICTRSAMPRVERVLGPVSERDAFADRVVLRGQLDRERAGQVGSRRRVRGGHPVGRAGLAGADRGDVDLAHVGVAAPTPSQAGVTSAGDAVWQWRPWSVQYLRRSGYCGVA